ncbi:ATPase, T2SS/T4P/T4SS family [Streptomyces sp. NBC_00378]|uniref:CpaF family protein n=1 Tax=Streptomyces sp. NBC_00378 TaxID=2975732 RepID=UPI0022558ACC|nr:ATPase, T2SS/T4P/T4SS family [Streptomyces sp. NBC_00378]MCX5115471.1 ATPase, T2SS/T4P/T4SS family [Streptomyces sp. NBC_00378]
MADQQLNGHGRAASPLQGVLRQALRPKDEQAPSSPPSSQVPGGHRSPPGNEPGPESTAHVAAAPGVLPVAWSVIKALQDAVATDIVEADEKHPLPTEADREERAVSMVAQRVSAWAVAHARSAAPLTAGQLNQVRQAVLDSMLKAGPLQVFLDDPDVENVVVHGDRTTVDYYNRPTKEVGSVAATHEDLIDLVNRLAQRSGHGERLLSPATPMVHFRLPDRSRAVATTLSGPPFLGIRRHRVMDARLHDLMSLGMISPALGAFIHAVVLAKKSLLISGNMGAGKTTLLRSAAREIPAGERVITLETDRELYLDEDPPTGTHFVAMEARESNGEVGRDGRLSGQVTIADMYPTTLRMLASRVIVGEVRGVEAASMLDAMSSGGRGSMCTLHADSPRLVLPRLTQLCRPAGMSREEIHELIANSVDFIVYVTQLDETARGGRRHRFVSHLWQITPGEAGSPSFTEVFAPDPGSGEPRAVPQLPPSGECMGQLMDVGFDRRWLEPVHGRWNKELEVVKRR